MHNIKELSELLSLLKTNGVSIFKDGTLELHLRDMDVAKGVQEIPVSEEIFPPDLRTDAVTDYDKILNWSAPNEDAPLPLTGEES